MYQTPLSQLSARVLWTLGGEAQIYVEDSHLRMRALWGPLRTRLFTKGEGLVLVSGEGWASLAFFGGGGAEAGIVYACGGEDGYCL